MDVPTLKEAMLYKALSERKVECQLCQFRCKIPDGKSGICGVRINRNGKLFSLVYGKIIANNVDPIEKKPLFHIIPGSDIYSIATIGCNFRCNFCQNWQISQYLREYGSVPGRDWTPEEIIKDTLRYNSQGIAFTYTEPTIFFEFAYDTAKLAKKEGLYTCFVTNGFITQEAIELIRPYLDAVNIDLKSFKEETYRKIIKGTLKGVLKGIETYKRKGIWVEITTLVIPHQNDSEEELRKIARFIASLDTNIPWHVTRFHPDYKMRYTFPTPLHILSRAREIGYEEGLRFVYTGNILGDPGENTYCPSCGDILIERYGLTLVKNHLRDGYCPRCGEKIPGIWKL